MDADDLYSLHGSEASTTGTEDGTSSVLTFANSVDDLLHGAKRQKSTRDPMSHRIIEKRRRDRMNNCLADLSRLIPTAYLKQGQGRIEKTEIIEMAIKHIKILQAQVDAANQSGNFASNKPAESAGRSAEATRDQGRSSGRRFHQGFKECQEETMRYLVEGESLPATDPFCLRLMDHLSAISQQFQSSYEHSDNAGIEGNRSTSSASGGDSLLPLLPTSGSLMVPASPVTDKHLRNLLTSRALQLLEADRAAAGDRGSGVNSVPCTTTCVSVASHLSQGPCSLDGTASEGPSSGYVSDMIPDSVSCSSSDWVMGPKDGNIYKFKHNITQRFSQEGNSNQRFSPEGNSSQRFSPESNSSQRFSQENNLPQRLSQENNLPQRFSPEVSLPQRFSQENNLSKRFSQEGKLDPHPYDGSSSASSKDADEEHLHRPLKHKKCRSRHVSSSDSGPYPTSDTSVDRSTSSQESGEGTSDKNRALKGEKCEGGPSMPLPGFVLHPSGTHYMPMSVCYQHLPSFLHGEASQGPSVFHPISIPVHFKGPVISMPSAALCSQTPSLSSNCCSLKPTREVEAM